MDKISLSFKERAGERSFERAGERSFGEGRGEVL